MFLLFSLIVLISVLMLFVVRHFWSINNPGHRLTSVTDQFGSDYLFMGETRATEENFDFATHTPQEAHAYLQRRFAHTLHLGDGLYIDPQAEYFFYDLGRKNGNLYYIENFDEVENYQVVNETKTTRTIAANFLDFDDDNFVQTTLSCQKNEAIGTSPADYFEELLAQCVQRNQVTHDNYLFQQEG